MCLKGSGENNMTRVDLNHTSLEYVACGNGPQVVFVHGSASDHRTWEHQLEVFANSFRVLSYSRRYHWPNEPIPDGIEYAMSEQLDDLEQLVG
jgi:pimeloyl-ACP methyl ester carboxylesterase